MTDLLSCRQVEHVHLDASPEMFEKIGHADMQSELRSRALMNLPISRCALDKAGDDSDDLCACRSYGNRRKSTFFRRV